MVAAVLDDATPPTRLDLLNCGFSAEYFFKSVECLRPSSPSCLKMQIEDWLQLDQMVRDSIDNFKRMWRERAAHRRSQTDWATTEVLTKGGKSFKKEIDEEDLMPGSIVKVALGERVRSVSVYITNGGNTRMRPKSRSEWRRKLCKVLVDVCLLNGSSKVNPSAIKETTNHLSYLQLEVHGNRTFVGNTLQWREIGFVIEMKDGKMNWLKSTLQLICILNGFADLRVANFVQEQFLVKAVISLTMTNTGAVAIAGVDAVRWPGLKCLGTTID